jgi:hypothetical protein
MEINTPKDLLQTYYYLVQAHTTLRPGPKFRAILKKAGIQEIDPPTKSELDAYFRELTAMQSRNNVPKNNFLKESRSMPIAVMAGGNFFRRIHNTIRNLRNPLVTSAIGVAMSLLGAVYIGHFAPNIREGRLVDPDRAFMNDGTDGFNFALALVATVAGPLMIMGALGEREQGVENNNADAIPGPLELQRRVAQLPLAPAARIPALQRRLDDLFAERTEFLEGFQRYIHRRNAQRRGVEAFEEREENIPANNPRFILNQPRDGIRHFHPDHILAIDRQIANIELQIRIEQARLHGMIDVLQIPSSGEFPIRASDRKQDPVTFVDFQTGDRIAIIGDDANARRNPVLVDSLQAWIAARIAGGHRDIPNPAGFGPAVTEDNVTVYTVRITQDGGRKKECKSRKARKSKTSTRKH